MKGFPQLLCSLRIQTGEWGCQENTGSLRRGGGTEMKGNLGQWVLVNLAYKDITNMAESDVCGTSAHPRMAHGPSCQRQSLDD